MDERALLWQVVFHLTFVVFRRDCWALMDFIASKTPKHGYGDELTTYCGQTALDWLFTGWPVRGPTVVWLGRVFTPIWRAPRR